MAIWVYSAHTSRTTQARDFKFAEAAVQRSYVVMVALTKNDSVVGFVMEGHKRDRI